MKVCHHEFLAETNTESEVGDYIVMTLNNSVQEEANCDVEEETSNEIPS